MKWGEPPPPRPPEQSRLEVENENDLDRTRRSKASDVSARSRSAVAETGKGNKDEQAADGNKVKREEENEKSEKKRNQRKVRKLRHRCPSRANHLASGFRSLDFPRIRLLPKLTPGQLVFRSNDYFNSYHVRFGRNLVTLSVILNDFAHFARPIFKHVHTKGAPQQYPPQSSADHVTV